MNCKGINNYYAKIEQCQNLFQHLNSMRTYKCNENTETKQKFLLAICLSTYLRFNHPAYNLKLKDCKDFCFYKFLFYVGKLLYLKSIQNKFEVIM